MSFFSKTITDDGDQRGRVFQWARESRVWMHLTAFLIFSALVHGAGFYMFKVVYPSPMREAVQPATIQVLTPTDPNVRSLLSKLSDRSIYLTAPSAGSDLRKRIAADPIRFSPSFPGLEVEPVPPSSLRLSPGAPESIAGINAPVGLSRVKLGPDLTDCVVAPWSLLDDFVAAASDLPLVRCHLEVTAEGKVRVESITGELDELEKYDLGQAVESTLRFQPSPTVKKGWIELGGE